MKSKKEDKIEIDLDKNLKHHLLLEEYIDILNEMKIHNMEHMLDDAELVIQVEDFNEDNIEEIKKCKKISKIGDLDYYRIEIDPYDIDKIIEHGSIESIEMNASLKTH